MPLPFAQLQIGREDNKAVQCGKLARSSPSAKDDIGCLDANGSLSMLDRADHRVLERENVITTHPTFIEIAVFGIPDERWGEWCA